MVRSCLLFLVEQASQTCWASLPDLLSKPLRLAGQASHACRTSFVKRDGRVRAFVLSGAHTKDGLYLLWACGHGPIGLVNGLIGLAKPYFIFYPLQLHLGGESQWSPHPPFWLSKKEKVWAKTKTSQDTKQVNPINCKIWLVALHLNCFLRWPVSKLKVTESVNLIRAYFR